MTASFLFKILESLNSPLGSAIIGGLVGGGITFFGVRATIKHEHKKQHSLTQAEVKSFCQAIQTELEALLNRYLESIGNALGSTKSGDPFLFTHHATEDYFTIFNSNAHLIGKIDDTNLRVRIVNTYIKAKSLIDSLKTNTELVNHYDNFFFRSTCSSDPFNLQQRDLYLSRLKGYSPQLILMHSSFVEYTEATIISLKK